jgi:hypothetical protein
MRFCCFYFRWTCTDQVSHKIYTKQHQIYQKLTVSPKIELTSFPLITVLSATSRQLLLGVGSSRGVIKKYYNPTISHAYSSKVPHDRSAPDSNVPQCVQERVPRGPSHNIIHPIVVLQAVPQLIKTRKTMNNTPL